MELDEAQRDAVDLAGDVKREMVIFATSPLFQRHLQKILREEQKNSPDAPGIEMAAVERLLFEFRYDDGTTVVDRFLRRPGLSEREREIARGFADGIEGYFEVLSDIPQGARAFTARCCFSDLEHVVAPTLPEGIWQLNHGSFLVGRLNPVAGTDLWTFSGATRNLPPSSRPAVAEAAKQMTFESPWLTHRNPAKRKAAQEQVAAMHERFLAAHGADQILVPGADLADLYAQALVSEDGHDAEQVGSGRAMARRSITESELADAKEVLFHSHPVAGFGFYLGLTDVIRALERGEDGDPDDIEALRQCLDDPSTPNWLLHRYITDHLPASQAALARALHKPDFNWDRDGEALLASCPGDPEPVLSLSIVPSIAQEQP